MTDSPDEHAVRLELPALASHVRLARLVAGGLASLQGYDVDAVEDLRIAVDELCCRLLEVGDGSPLVLDFGVVGVVVEVAGRTGRRPAAAIERGHQELSDQILAVACQTYRIWLEPAEAQFWLRSRSPNG